MKLSLPHKYRDKTLFHGMYLSWHSPCVFFFFIFFSLFFHVPSESGDKLKLQLRVCMKKCSYVRLIHVPENKHLEMENLVYFYFCLFIIAGKTLHKCSWICCFGRVFCSLLPVPADHWNSPERGDSHFLGIVTKILSIFFFSQSTLNSFASDTRHCISKELELMALL